MFMGEYQHSLDVKGRLFMPAKFREELGEKFIITKGLDKCLFIYSQSEWTLLEAKLRALPFTKPEARAFVRMFFSGAAECETDKQGRFLIPANLREYAGLEKDAVIVGVSTRAEIWSKDEWAKYTKQIEPEFANLASNLDLDLGI